MIIDEFFVKGWTITILYECTCDDIDYIIETLKRIKCPNKYIEEALNNLETCNLDIGLTYSNMTLKSSVIIVNKTSSFAQLINTIAHEYYHLICHISRALEITDEEELAYLNGDLNMRSY
jgi:Zn-dependent peptidase ImmA (M78 family)